MNNSVPDGWKKSSIGKITLTNSLFSDGDWVESKDQDPAGTNRLIQLADIGDGVFINKSSRYMNDEQFQRLKCTPLKKNDILIARMPDPLGRACLYPLESGKAATVVDVAVLRTENSDHYWLMSAINSSSYRYQIGLNASGTTRTRIARGILSEIEILEPPLPEQQKIATILSSVDDVIEKTRAQIDKLKDLKTGMMQELLTKGIGHTEFKDSPVGRIPKGWGVGTLDSFGVSVLDGDRGKEYPKEKDFYSFEHCLFLSAKNVTKKGFVFSELSFITKEKDELLRKGKLTRGDIVITTRGTVGNIAFYDNEVAFDNIRINSGMAIIRNSSTVLDPQFLHLLMDSPMVSEQVELLAFGSAQPQLTIGIIKSLDVPKPSFDEQKAIASAVTAMSTKLRLVNKKLNLLLSTKKALMQDLLTGKVRVKPNESAAR